MRDRELRLIVPAGVGYTVRYQHYYVLGFEEHLRVVTDAGPPWLRAVPGASRKLRVLERVHPRGSSGNVGRYVLGATKFAVDAQDNHAILPHDVQHLDWADVYFKANKWTDVEYDAKVRPIVNGNGIIRRRSIAHLRLLRARPRDIDLVFVSRIWGGREHNVRLFEEIAALDIRSHLVAILPAGAPPESDAAIIERLRAVGVPTTRVPLKTSELWDLLSRAKVVVFRSGMHLCVPWRMIDLLAMGACILFDAPPLPQWPEPLVSDVHYADMHILRGRDGLVDAAEHTKVAPAVESLLRDDEHQVALRANAARYFDEHAAPGRVARYVLDGLRA
jgi:hypothetical protein